MELRQLQAFVAVATELHFGRAAERLTLAQPTLSELIQRLERELGAPLLTRTTRRVALTPAGTELLGRATTILAAVSDAQEAVRNIGRGTAGTVRVGITPPVAPVLAPHLESALAELVPQVGLEVDRLWLPTLISALVAGDIDVALTCGVVTAPPGISSQVVCAEPLFVGLRADHPLAAAPAVAMAELALHTLGRPRDSLFPAWALAQRQALAAAGVEPPCLDLDDTDLAATRWQEQPGVDWILLLSSFLPQHPHTVVKPLHDTRFVPYSMLWRAQPGPTALVRRFLEVARTNVPAGWQPGPPTR